MSFPLIYSRDTKEKGRGVFSTEEIKEQVLIEKCPVILISSPEDINLVFFSSLKNYAFRWINNGDIIIALGYGSLYNHSPANNAFYKMNAEEETIDIIALKTISPDEEITVNYCPGEDSKTWFEDRGIACVK